MVPVAGGVGLYCTVPGVRLKAASGALFYFFVQRMAARQAAVAAVTAAAPLHATLRDYGRAVMLSTDPVAKATLTFEVCASLLADMRLGPLAHATRAQAHKRFARPATLDLASELGPAGAVDAPGVPAGVTIMAPQHMKGRKGGSPAARAAMVHGARVIASMLARPRCCPLRVYEEAGGAPLPTLLAVRPSGQLIVVRRSAHAH